MEDLIAQDVDAICVVPNDPNALVPTIEKAKEAGIVVVTHEAPGIADSVDLDVEAFVNETFGELFAEKVATAMGGKGKYAGLVGGLTRKLIWHGITQQFLIWKRIIRIWKMYPQSRTRMEIV